MQRRITGDKGFSATTLKSFGHRQGGFASIEWMVAVGFSFLFLVMVSNLVLVQYGQGLVRASVDEAARAGARFSSDPVTSCRNRAQDVLDGVGRLASNIEISCVVVNGQVRATTSADFEGWLPGIPSFHENAVATSGQEVAPL